MAKSNLERLKELSDKLSETEEELSAFFHLAPCLLAIANEATGHFIKVNPAWEHALGFTAEEICSKPWLCFIHPDDVKKTKEAAIQMDVGQNLLGFVNRYRHKDGHYRRIKWIASKFVSGRAYCVGVVETK